MVFQTAATLVAAYASIVVFQEPAVPRTRFLASAIVAIVIGGGVMLWEVVRARRAK